MSINRTILDDVNGSAEVEQRIAGAKKRINERLETLNEELASIVQGFVRINPPKVDLAKAMSGKQIAAAQAAADAEVRKAIMHMGFQYLTIVRNWETMCAIVHGTDRSLFPDLGNILRIEDPKAFEGLLIKRMSDECAALVRAEKAREEAIAAAKLAEEKQGPNPQEATVEETDIHPYGYEPEDSNGDIPPLPEPRWQDTDPSIIHSILLTWRRMSSAPKDGTRILLVYEDANAYMMTFGQWDLKRVKPGWHPDLVSVWGSAKTRGMEPIGWASCPEFAGGAALAAMADAVIGETDGT